MMIKMNPITVLPSFDKSSAIWGKLLTPLSVLLLAQKTQKRGQQTGIYRKRQRQAKNM